MSKDTEEGTKPPMELRKINCRKNSVVSLTESRESHKVIPSSNGSTSSQTLSPFLQTPLNPGHSRSWSETSLQLSEEAIESTIRFLNYGTENENVDPKFSFPLKFAWFREKLSWTLPIFVRVFHFCKVLSLLTKWSIILLARLGLGYKWIFMMIRTVLFAVCLGNVLIQYAPRYFWDKHLLRSVPYGPHGRNRLDILLPIPVHAFVQKRRRRPLPVVLFITGGAWTIGYKAWGYLLGQQVIARNHIFISADYRNYPQGTMDDMVMDISAVLQWTRNNIERYGGDVNNITIATQSAGSHITMLALMRQTMRSIGGPEWWKIDSVHPPEHAEPHLNDYEIDSVGSPPSSPLLNNNAIPEFSISCNKANSQEQFSPTARKTTSKHPTAVEMTWLPSDFKRFVGMGGVYDLSGLQCYLHQRGLYMWLLQGIVGNGRCINDLCPMSLLDHDVFRSNPDAVRNIMVPEMLFLHGDDDKSSPLWNCIRFAEGVRFRKYCSHVAVMVRRGHSHTDSMIEGIVDGSSDTANVMLTPVELMQGDCCEWVNGYPVRRSSQSVARNMKSKLVSSVSRTDSMFEQSGTPGPSLAYSWQTSLARWINPF